MLYDATAAKGYGFDLTSSGSKSAVTGITETSASDIQDVGSGWYRCSISAESTADVRVYVLNAFSGFSFAGNGTSGIYVWGAQLNLGSTAMSYQRIAATPTLSTPPTYATTSTMGGEVFRPYLFFDGADGYVTGAIDLTATDALLISGAAEKRRDSVQEYLFETTSTNGTCALLLRNPTPNQCRLRAYGGNTVDANGGTVLVGDRVILSGVTDISADICVLRVNKADAASNSADQGALTSYGSATFNVGARTNATSGWCDMHFYGLIVRAANSSTAQVNTVESYLASKMP